MFRWGRKELLTALDALWCFSTVIQGKLAAVYTDNTNVWNWLRAGRSSKMSGLRYLAVWELLKLKHMCKVIPSWLPGDHNVSADKLSRGVIPSWLIRKGSRRFYDLGKLASLWQLVEESWEYLLECLFISCFN